LDQLDEKTDFYIQTGEITNINYKARLILLENNTEDTGKYTLRIEINGVIVDTLQD
jgi:hypothetical protein